MNPDPNIPQSELVVVIGDLTMDWNLARPESFHDGSSWSTSDTIHSSLLQGGASLVAELVRNVIPTVNKSFAILPEVKNAEHFSPEDKQYHHSYALWSLFDYEEKTAPESIHVWRVDEFLGLQRSQNPSEIVSEWQQLANEIRRASVVIVDDAGLGFRDHPEVWKEPFSENDRSPWIILKMARPIAQGPLWEYLVTNFAQRLIVVIPVNDLRLTQAKISRELSWERTAEDLAWELTYSTEVSSLSRCAHVVISFDGAGALLFSNQTDNQNIASTSECTLFFEPQAMEGMWTKKRKGEMIGYTSCLVGAIARQVLVSSDGPDIKKGIQGGLDAIQTLHKEGYGKRKAGEPVPRLAFPFQALVNQITSDSKRFATAQVPIPLGLEKSTNGPSAKLSQWTILQQRYAKATDGKQTGIYLVAEEIVRKGLNATIKDVPLGRFGGLVTVDRKEIEGFRSIGRLICEYLLQRKAERPLSIAVFGAPGSGKSFGISEVAKSISPGEIQKLTFNLSQFSAPEELLGALHQVRDVALSEKIPLVFWDEFDSSLRESPLGWLRYFLSPMQDGTFQQGEITHPIGRSIFVFAGGMNRSREEFESTIEKNPTAKGLDFLSRLKGHLRILGPDADIGDTENHAVIRRAILLRSFLERSALQIFHPRDPKGIADLDSGVLRAFLRIPAYRHGVRSIESIVAMSSLAGKNRFERSSLPPEEQLDLHVNGQMFLALVQQIEFDRQNKLLEELAEKAHAVYCDGVRKTENKPPFLDQPYATLPDEIKEQNRDQVRNIQAMLDLAGYVMVPARVSDPVFLFPPHDVELLAVYEHARWMEMKVRNGWRYAAERDDNTKLHPDLLPWRSKLIDESQQVNYSREVLEAIGQDELSEPAKEKNRDSVRGLPVILARAGYTIVKVKV